VRSQQSRVSVEDKEKFNTTPVVFLKRLRINEPQVDDKVMEKLMLSINGFKKMD